MDDNRYKLYEQLSENYDMGDFAQFDKDLDDENNQKVAWEAMGGQEGYGDFDLFKKYIERSPQQEVVNQPEVQDVEQPDETQQVETSQGDASANTADGEVQTDNVVTTPDVTPAADAGTTTEPVQEVDYTQLSDDELKRGMGVMPGHELTQRDIDSRASYIRTLSETDPDKAAVENERLNKSINEYNRRLSVAQAMADAEKSLSVAANIPVNQEGMMTEELAREIQQGTNENIQKLVVGDGKGNSPLNRALNMPTMWVKFNNLKEAMRGMSVGQLQDIVNEGANNRAGTDSLYFTDEEAAIHVQAALAELAAREKGGHAKSFGEEESERYYNNTYIEFDGVHDATRQKKFLDDVRYHQEAYNKGRAGHATILSKDSAALTDCPVYAVPRIMADLWNRDIKKIALEAAAKTGGNLGALALNEGKALWDFLSSSDFDKVCQEAIRMFGPEKMQGYVMSWVTMYQTTEEQAQQEISAMIQREFIKLSGITPSNDLEYTLGSVANNIFPTQIIKAIWGATHDVKPDSFNYINVQQQTYKQYEDTKASGYAKVLAPVITIVGDTYCGGFYFPSKIAQLSTAGMARLLTSGTKASVRSLMESAIWRVEMGALSGATNFATYEMQSMATQQLATGAYRVDKNGKEQNIWYSLGSFIGAEAHAGVSGTVKGMAFGTISETASAAFSNVSGLTVYLGEGTKFLAEGGAFTVMGALENGKPKKPSTKGGIIGWLENHGVTLKDIGTNFGMALSGKITHADRLIKDIRARANNEGIYGTKVNYHKISDEQVRMLADKGYTEIAYALQGNIFGNADLKRMKHKLDLMRKDKDVPWEIVRMADWVLKGQLTIPPRMERYNVDPVEGGGYLITAVDGDGRAILGGVYAKNDSQRDAIVHQLEHEKEKTSWAYNEQKMYGTIAGRQLTQCISDYATEKGLKFEEAFMAYMNAAGKDADQLELGTVEREVYEGVNAIAKGLPPISDIRDTKRTIGERFGVDIDKAINTPKDKRTQQQVNALEQYKEWLDGRKDVIDMREDNATRRTAADSVAEQPGVEQKEVVVETPKEKKEEPPVVTEPPVTEPIVETKQPEVVEQPTQKKEIPGDPANMDDVELNKDVLELSDEFIAQLNENPEMRDAYLAEVEQSRALAHAYANGEVDTIDQKMWDYWKRRDGLSDPAPKEQPAPAAVQEPTPAQPEVPPVAPATPAAKVDVGGDMPKREVDGKQKADFSATTPEKGHEYVYNELGLSKEDADNIVASNVADADAKLTELNNNKPKKEPGEDTEDYVERLNAWKAEKEAAQNELDYWNKVKAREESLNAPKEVEKPETPAVEETTPPPAPTQTVKPEARMPKGSNANAETLDPATLPENDRLSRMVDAWGNVTRAEVVGENGDGTTRVRFWFKQRPDNRGVDVNMELGRGKPAVSTDDQKMNDVLDSALAESGEGGTTLLRERVSEENKPQENPEEIETVEVEKWRNGAAVGRVVVVHGVDEVTNETARKQILEAEKTGKRVTGWYETDTDTAYVYMPHIYDSADLHMTLMHEVITHKGLRGLFKDKEEYNRFLDSVYADMGEPERKFYDEYPGGKKGETELEHKRRAADEFLANWSEDVDVDKRTNQLWVGIRKGIKDWMRKHGVNVFYNDEYDEIIRKSFREFMKNQGGVKPTSETGKGGEDIRPRLGDDEKTFKDRQERAVKEKGVVMPGLNSGSTLLRVRDDEKRRPTFYSNAERAVEGVTQEKATAEQWKAMLTKAGGIKAGEDKWMGLSDWLDEHKGEKLSKDEVLQFVRDNGIEMEEVEYGNITASPRYQELNSEYQELVNNVDAIYQKASKAFADFNKEMEAKYGEDFMDKWTRDEYMTYRRLAREQEDRDPYINSPEDIAMREMVNRYGDDFDLAFGGDGENLYVADNDAASEMTGVNGINETRANYTTNGLENKREIAFVLPDVEPYQEHDEIHFGPENEGKAVMWVRFGETTDSEGNRVLVIDEIQSNRHQDAREKGYRDRTVKERYEQAQKAYLDYGNALAEKYNVPKNWVFTSANDAERKQMHSLLKAEQEAHRAYKESYSVYSTAVPYAPFEKNWHEVAMKRMLRLAADEGFDKVAWTTGAQQADRYNMESSIGKIYASKTGDLYHLEVYKPNGEELRMQGMIGDSRSSGDFTKEQLKHAFGSAAANEIVSAVEKLPHGEEVDKLREEHQVQQTRESLRKYRAATTAEIDGKDLFKGEGMKGFYDEILPRFMNKYGKRWGTQVGEVQLDTPGHEVMHSVDVTPAMKESVQQGQPLFRVKDEDKRARRDSEESKTIFDAAKKKFGTTYDIREAGYILPDGTMLDFSGRHELMGGDDSFLSGTRTTDHRGISDVSFVYDQEGNEVETGIETNMADFIGRGAIRIDNNAGSINLDMTPTREQEKALRRLIANNDGDVWVDFGNGDNSEHYVEYEGAKPTRILGDIDRYYSEGIKPQSNTLFRVRDEKAVERLDEEGFETSDDGDIRFSYRYPLDDKRRKKSINDIVLVTGVTRRRANQWLNNVSSLTSYIFGDPESYANYTPDDRYKAIKNNSDYPQGTVDFNNICPKRKDFTAIWSILQHENPDRIFTAEDLETIRQTMIDDGYDVACGLCFVEGRRKFLGEIAQQFIDGMKDGTLKPEVKKILGDETYVPTIDELLTTESSDKLRAEHPQVYDAFVRMNNARGMQAGRLYENYAEYKREILDWDDRKVKAVNDAGGLRIFSFSDFEATHLLDIIQIISDCAARGVKIQGYTKVPSFAKAVRNTGIKLNRSLIPAGIGIKEVDGKKVLDYDTTEGIDINDPDFLDETDNPNIGNILVGISDEHIRLAMVDPFVDYIIGYHASGIGKDLRKMKGIDHWVDYTSTQSDRDLATGKKADKQINIYTDVLQAAEAEGKPITNKREFVEKFLEVAKERGLDPRFSQFLDKDADGNYVYTEGYHKFLIDFKLFDKDGNIVPQEVVRPDFDLDYCKKILDDYAKGAKVEKDYSPTLAKLREKFGLEQPESDINFRIRDDEHRERVEDAKRRLEDPNASEFEKQAARTVINAYGEDDGGDDGGNGGGINFRVAPRVQAADEYERRVKSAGFQVTEALQDSMMGLKALMQSIVGKDSKGKDKAIQEIEGFQNAYLKENRLQSESVAQVEEYDTKYYDPLVKVVNKLMGEGKKSERADARTELNYYMIAKHGLERNVVMAERDAKKAFESDENKDANGNPIKSYQEFLDENRKKDYSGLTALTGENKVADAEAAAQQMVDAYESSHDTNDVTALWDLTRAATRNTLDKLHDCGIISDETYDKTKDMFEYYIPLRGWDEKTSDEVYGYLTGPDGPINGNVFKHAEGRKSLADDPLATIKLMANDAIRQGNRNVMKQRFLTFVMNNPSDIVSVSKLWLKKDDVTGQWNPVFADLDPTDTPEEVRLKTEQFEQQMKQLAQQDPDHYKQSSQKANIPYKVVNNNIGEHRVLVKHKGQTYVLTINGNPRAAQALNGLTNPDKGGGPLEPILNAAARVNRFLSQAFTTYNPKFVVRNFERDMLYSVTSSGFVKEDTSYGKKLLANYSTVGSLYKLFNKWENGTLDRSNHTEDMFYQFMHNGGETGFSAPMDIETFKKSLNKELARENSKTRRAVHSFAEFYLRVSRAVENRARFAAFLTSMEEGRGIDRSIWDAKEVSVNFNKKGAGARMKKSPDQTWIGKGAGIIGDVGRSLFVFWNAAVQSLTNYGRLYKVSPIKASAHTAFRAALGYLMPQLIQALLGDDDDSYYDLPEHTRRNNICFRWSKDMPWFTIPLPPEHAVSYAIGDVTAGWLHGKKQYFNAEEVMNDFAGEISKSLPVDFTEGGGGHWWMPTFAKPLYEAYEKNESWTGAPIANETPFNEDAPEYQRVYKTTSRPFVKATEALNNLTNSDEDSKGVINWNPAKLEYVVKGYAGGLFTLFNDCIRMYDVAFNDAEMETHDIPIVGAFLKSGNPTTKAKQIKSLYYKYKDDAEGAKWELKNREGEDLERFKQTDRYQRYLVYKELSKEVDEIKKEMKKSDDPELEQRYNAAIEKLVTAMQEQHAGKRKPSQEMLDKVKTDEYNDSIKALPDKDVQDKIVALGDSATQESLDVKREGIKREYKKEGLSYSKPEDDEKNSLAYERSANYYDISEDAVLKGRRDALKKSVGKEFEKMGVKYQNGSNGWGWYITDEKADAEKIKAFRQAHKEELDEYGILVWWFGQSKGSSGYIKKGFTDGEHNPDEVMKEYRETRKKVLAKVKRR